MWAPSRSTRHKSPAATHSFAPQQQESFIWILRTAQLPQVNLSYPCQSFGQLLLISFPAPWHMYLRRLFGFASATASSPCCWCRLCCILLAFCLCLRCNPVQEESICLECTVMLCCYPFCILMGSFFSVQQGRGRCIEQGKAGAEAVYQMSLYQVRQNQKVPASQVVPRSRQTDCKLCPIALLFT